MISALVTVIFYNWMCAIFSLLNLELEIPLLIFRPTSYRLLAYRPTDQSEPVTCHWLAAYRLLDTSIDQSEPVTHHWLMSHRHCLRTIAPSPAY